MIYEEDGYQWAGSDQPFATPYIAEAALRSLEDKAQKLFQGVCQNLPTAESYIKQHAATFGWKTALIEAAKTYSAAELPLPIKYFDPPWWCYENSFLHAKATEKKYIEGIVVTPTGVYVHAWNSHGDDVMDYTYPMQHLNSYFGIEFDVALVEAHWPIKGGLLGYLHDEVKAGKPGFAHRLLYG